MRELSHFKYENLGEDMSTFTWTCPYCSQNATIGNANRSGQKHLFDIGNKHEENLALYTMVITCPNETCKEYEISAKLDLFNSDTQLLSWQLKPNSSAKQFPDYIPKAILDDYNEACLKSKSVCNIVPSLLAGDDSRFLWDI